MGKGKRKHPSVEDVLSRPFCYYCERDFDDLKILIQHQKAKHFRCTKCNRRLNTAGGLSVHMSQVHKEPLDSIDNALPNRQHTDIEIFAMEGIPEDVLQQHNQRITQEFYSAEADHRAVTGNPASGPNQQGGPGAKKPKIESAEELKKRLAEHKAKKAAEQASQGSAQNTPGPQAASPPHVQFPSSYTPHQATPPQPGHVHPFAQPPYHQQPSPFEYNDGAFGGAPPHQQGPYGPPGQFGHPQPQYSPPQQFGAPNGSASYPPPQYAYQGSPPLGMPHSMSPYPPPPTSQRFNPPPSGSPGGGAAAQTPFQRQNNLPVAPGLPVRPSFDAPPVSRSQLQVMHQGPAQAHHIQQSTSEAQNISNSVDDLISDAQQNARASAVPEKNASEGSATPRAPEKKGTPKPVAKESGPGKKTKNASRMVITDQAESPEEKLARMPRFAFTPRKREEVARGPVEAAVTGPVRGSDDVADAVQG